MWSETIAGQKLFLVLFTKINLSMFVWISDWRITANSHTVSHFSRFTFKRQIQVCILTMLKQLIRVGSGWFCCPGVTLLHPTGQVTETFMNSRTGSPPSFPVIWPANPRGSLQMQVSMTKDHCKLATWSGTDLGRLLFYFESGYGPNRHNQISKLPWIYSETSIWRAWVGT